MSIKELKVALKCLITWEVFILYFNYDLSFIVITNLLFITIKACKIQSCPKNYIKDKDKEGRAIAT